MEVLEKRKSIIHVQNIFLMNPINIYPVRTTEKYIIGYEPKEYRIHNLLFKISKDLINEPQDSITLNTGLDVNVREDYRYNIKANDPKWNIKTKNITVRIIPTRYTDLSPLYGTFYYFGWRKTNAGGRDYIEFDIPECPIIVNANTINGICYKLISKQISGTGTHALHVYLIISSQRGQFQIGKWVKITNVNNGGNQHMYIKDVVITL